MEQTTGLTKQSSECRRVGVYTDQKREVKASKETPSEAKVERSRQYHDRHTATETTFGSSPNNRGGGAEGRQRLISQG